MKLEDFKFCGFTDFSRIIIARDVAEAKKVAKFLGSNSFNEAFEENGPGKYYVRVTEGWDRSGDYAVHDIVFIREEALTWEDTAKKLKALKKAKDNLYEPFVIAERLQREAKQKGLSYTDAEQQLLTPKERKQYASMDLNAHDEADSMLGNFLEGGLG